MDEPPSPLRKSRIPRKTVIVTDRNLFNYPREFIINDAHCPLRKGIICYRRNDTIFEHNIQSSGKHEPRIIVPKHSSRNLMRMSFVPIKGSRILLFARYYANGGWKTPQADYLHLSIHEIRSDHRVGSALWSFNGSVDGHFNIHDLELIKSTENALGITFCVRFNDHWKLFDISTTETDTSNNFPLIESGRIDFDLKFELIRSIQDASPVLSPDKHILLNMDMKDRRHNEMIDIHHLDCGTKFSFVTRLSIPIAETPINQAPQFAFSADGSKLAMAMGRGGVSVWDIRSKVPLRTFTELPWPKHTFRPRQFLQFSCGNLGKEILVFVEHDFNARVAIIHVIDAALFETEEKLFFNFGNFEVRTLFFDPNGGTLYAEHNGTIYEWDLRKNEPGPEWWIGEEQNVHLDKNTFHHQSTTGTKWLFTTSMVAIISCSCIISLLAFMIRTLAASM